jgi:nucleoside-diphosphate-sugar epimerase
MAVDRRQLLPRELLRREFLALVGATLAGCATTPPRRAARAAGKRILILGGTNFVGPAIVEAARARGHRLTLFNRGKTNPMLFPDVERIVGDRRTDIDKLRGREWDAVIDTWVNLPRTVRTAAELLRDHVGQYLFLSTISVYQLGRDDIDERSPVLTIADEKAEKLDDKSYGPLKALAERAAAEAMPGRATALRAGVIVGPRDPSDRFLYWPLRLSRGGEVLVPGERSDRMAFIDARDLADFVVAAVEKRLVGTYNVVGPADPTLGVVLDSMAATVGKEARLTFADGKFLDANQAGGWGDFPLVVGHDDDQAGFARVSAARAVAAGLQFRSPGVTAADTLAWWNELPDQRRNQARPGMAPEREAELLRRWHERAITSG